MMKVNPNTPEGLSEGLLEGPSRELPKVFMDPKVLAMLVCPASHQPLAVGDTKLTAKVLARISAGNLTSIGGGKFKESLDGLLVRQDGQVAYPIQDGIPLLLVESGIDLTSLVEAS